MSWVAAVASAFLILCLFAIAGLIIYAALWAVDQAVEKETARSPGGRKNAPSGRNRSRHHNDSPHTP